MLCLQYLQFLMIEYFSHTLELSENLTTGITGVDLALIKDHEVNTDVR